MATQVMELASPVLLYLAGLQRRAARGEATAPETARDDLLTLVREADQRAATSAGLRDTWPVAKEALIYLIDDLLTRRGLWSHGERWQQWLFERSLLGRETPRRDDAFFEQLDARLAGPPPPAGGSSDHDDLLGVYLVCLQFGFAGRYAKSAGGAREIQQRVQQLLAALPATARTRTKELFPDAYQHTVVLPPRYQPLMRVSVVAAALAAVVLTFLVVRGQLWNSLQGQLTDLATQAGSDFRAEGG